MTLGAGLKGNCWSKADFMKFMEAEFNRLKQAKTMRWMRKKFTQSRCGQARGPLGSKVAMTPCQDRSP